MRTPVIAAGLIAAIHMVAPTGAALHALPPRTAAVPVVREYTKEFRTYPFSDPDPIPAVGRIYPYFRFDGFTDRGEARPWKIVELENDYLKIQILPQIGGKIWNAVDKRTNRSFIYNNAVVKFRDIAMRGPWTSGGIEANYGIIGHTPNVSTPVDYVTRTNDDGSVSCIVGALDLLTRTPWRLEIRLGKDDAAFSTTSFWYNASPLEQPYYSWMNAGIKVKGKLQFIYPGTSFLGHNGEVGPWPLNGGGRDVSWYDNNDFGGYKSYHVFGQATDFVGAYWHDEDFGMVRYGSRDEKAGKKLWIWGLSRQGMIWENLLTDTDGQYAEVQSGRLFNQSAEQSTYTPFKHRGFAPHTVDRWTEYWYPVAGTKGIQVASRVGALNAVVSGDRLVLTLSPVVPIADSLVVYNGARRIGATYVKRAPLQLSVDTFAIKGVPRDSLRAVLGDQLLTYRADAKTDALARPVDGPATFDWNSGYGLYLRGKEWIRQRDYAQARIVLDSALGVQPNFVPALADRAMLHLRAGQYANARAISMMAMRVDTYDGAANYYYGLANRRLGRRADAKDGFEIAALSPEYRGAAWTELARVSLADSALGAATSYADKALIVDGDNLDALGVAIVAARRRGDQSAWNRYLTRLEHADRLSHLARAERALSDSPERFGATIAAGVRAELPEQVLLELASWYLEVGDVDVARRVLEAVGDHPEALYWRAYLTRGTRQSDSLRTRGDAMSIRFVTPFRPELEPVLAWASSVSTSWKPAYYRALVLWATDNVQQAGTQLAQLGDRPDDAVFYALRATMTGRDESAIARDLERAAGMDSTQWRYGKRLADYWLAPDRARDAVKAVGIAKRYAARFPSNYILGLTLVKAHVAAKQFREADKLLSTLRVLPYEGAKDGHLLYRQTKLALAEEAIAARKWSVAGAHIEAARLWPERLGAGKPYDEDIDHRWEDSLQAVVAARGVVRPAGTESGTARGATQDSLRYGIGTWEPDSLGNHRAVVRVEQAGDAVFARIPWRRRDLSPASVHLSIVSAVTQRSVANVARVDIRREFGDVVFQALTPGDYYVYYLPYTGTFSSNYPKITYRPVQLTADSGWLTRHSLLSASGPVSAARTLPAAKVLGFDAVNAFSRFTEMEYIAGSDESEALRKQYPQAPYLAFAEDRARSIRMQFDIPHNWAVRGPLQPFSGLARRGEFFTFQVGLWAHRTAVDSLRYRASDFVRRGGGERIASSAVTAFNLEGTDWSGRRFTRALHVDSGAVQPLWFGVDVSGRTVPGDYEGRVTLSSRGGADQIVPVVLRVTAETVLNHGDDDPQQLTRLRWLNSQLAADDEIVAPYVPMRVTGSTITLLGRSLTFGTDGMPTSIRSFFSPNNTSIGATSREILSAPICLVVRDAANRDIAWTGPAPQVTKRALGAVAWETRKSSGDLQLHSQATLEFDGTAEYQIALKATSRTILSDVRFELPMRADAAKYMMGLGQRGGLRPPSVVWKWDVQTKNQDAAWLGDVNAGLQFTLKDEHYLRPLNTNFYLSKPLIAPRSWANGGKGGCTITTEGERVVAACTSGQHVLAAGDSLRFDFRLMITPFKPLDTQGQWGTRFFHAFVPVDSIKGRGANTVNVHHANRINPWINYPFIETAPMRAYIDSAHAQGLRAKIYYTVRELTNHAPELFALRSLGDEVLSRGPGGGFSWLQEHLGDDYIAAWHVPTNKDAAVVNSGVSRWHNFYIEGLDRLVKHEKIDGLYLDDVAFDRLTMKRVRKVLDRGNPGALLDLHSANQYNPRDGFASSANLYLEHFPFINRLWFGEYFDYDSAPDYWLVEVSGIPFGLMGEMLEKGGNPWRGMTMGMTARLPWSGDPAPLWKVWDEFGIQRSTLHGWWSGADPVTTTNDQLRVTTWSKAGSAMVSIGSWSTVDTKVRLTIDWKALGLDPSRMRIRAPEISQFQAAATWSPDGEIIVPATKGLLLLIERRP